MSESTTSTETFEVNEVNVECEVVCENEVREKRFTFWHVLAEIELFCCMSSVEMPQKEKTFL